jgi:hypothetical protein
MSEKRYSEEAQINLLSLLRAYAEPNSNVTRKELYFGNRDAVALIDQLKAERDEARSVAERWRDKWIETWSLPMQKTLTGVGHGATLPWERSAEGGE